MPVPQDDEYWVRFAAQFVAIAEAGATFPMQAMAKATGRTPKGIATTVARLRKKGLIAGIAETENRNKPKLTPHGQALLEKIRLRDESKITFEVEVHANTKAEALAEVWDVVVQLEAWDPKQGPFKLTPARMRNFGKEQHD